MLVEIFEYLCSLWAKLVAFLFALMNEDDLSSKKADVKDDYNEKERWSRGFQYDRVPVNNSYFRQRQHTTDSSQPTQNNMRLPRPAQIERPYKKIGGMEAVPNETPNISAKPNDEVLSNIKTALFQNSKFDDCIGIGLRGSQPLILLDRVGMLCKSQMGNETEQQSHPNDSPTHFEYPTHQNSRLPTNIPLIHFTELTLEQVIGGGGFGQVWRADWKGTPVAVKMLSNICQHQVPEQVLRSFEEEVSMIAHLRHPNICLFLGVCLDPPNRAIVTEVVSRGSLWDALRNPNLFPNESPRVVSSPTARAGKHFNMADFGGAAGAAAGGGAAGGAAGGGSKTFRLWPTWAIRKVLEGTCRGLIYLHSRDPKVIHRDLKSANLLIDESFNVKICDFGLAKLRDYTTVLTANVGTIQWMAPEVLTGSEYNESVDIFSTGIVIWEMLTGECPYQGMSQIEVAISVTQKNIRPTLPGYCTKAQADLLNNCWATNPLLRHTADILLKEINNAFPMNY